MGFIKNRIKEFKNQTYTIYDKELLEILGIETDDNKRLGEITYFTCLKKLSESIAQIPLKINRNTEDGHIQDNTHYLYKRLKDINPYMNPSIFWGCVEVNRNHFGNAYIYIERFKFGKDAGKVKALWILPSDQVTVWLDNKGLFSTENALWYEWKESKTGKEYLFNHKEIIHLKTIVSLDGITGLAIKDILKLQLETSRKGQELLNRFYKSGMFGGKAILQYTGDLDKTAEKRLVSKIESFADGTSTASGSIIPIPLGFQMQPLNLSMNEAQFIQLNQYSALQVASAFGIKPTQINMYEKGSYKDIETQQRDFYLNTSMCIFKQYEEELTRKLLSYTDIFESNLEVAYEVNAILRGDFKTQVETLGIGIDKGFIKINEARKYLGFTKVEEGDVLLANGTYIPVKMIQEGINYKKEGGEKD